MIRLRLKRKICYHYNPQILIVVSPRYRYKIVVTVTMGERYMQGMKSIAQFLWDPEKDSYVSWVYDSSPSLFAVATIYALYHE